MTCPNCGKKITFMDMTWQERLFWMCLITIALNQSAQLTDLLRDYYLFYMGRI